MHSKVWIILILAYCSTFTGFVVGKAFRSPPGSVEHPDSQSTQLLWQWLNQNWKPAEDRLFLEAKDHRLDLDLKDNEQIYKNDAVPVDYDNPVYSSEAEETEVDTEPRENDNTFKFESINTWSPSANKRSSLPPSLSSHLAAMNPERTGAVQEDPRLLGLLGSHKLLAKLSSHGDQFVKQVIKNAARRHSMKRSPNCMRKCMAQGLLHPAQCHSLC